MSRRSVCPLHVPSPLGFPGLFCSRKAPVAIYAKPFPPILSLGVLVRPEETVDLLNSWPQILSCIQEIRREPPRLSSFDEVSTSVKTVDVLLVSQGIALVAAVITVITSNLTACLFPLVKRLGIIPEGILPHFGWQLLFFPLEYLTYIPPMFITSLSGAILMVLVGVLKLCMQELG